MDDMRSLVSAVMRAADGTIVGRIRMQKIFYLLEQLGLGAGLSFSYYHYGPFSRDLSDAIDRLTTEESGVVNEVVQPMENGSYSVFKEVKGGNTDGAVEWVGNIPFDRARRLITLMKTPPSTVIELAATIHWLRHVEEVGDWQKEIRIRKPLKATDERIAAAENLLAEIDLAA